MWVYVCALTVWVFNVPVRGFLEYNEIQLRDFDIELNIILNIEIL